MAFLLALAPPLPQCEGSPEKIAACVPSVGLWIWFQKEQSRSRLHVIVYLYSNPSETYLKVLVSVLPNSDLRPEKWWALLENVAR